MEMAEPRGGARKSDSCPVIVMTRSYGSLFANLLEELKNGEIESHGDDFKRVECGVRLTAFKSADVRLIKAAAFAEHHLVYALLDAESSDSHSNSEGQGLFHENKCP